MIYHDNYRLTQPSTPALQVWLSLSLIFTPWWKIIMFRVKLQQIASTTLEYSDLAELCSLDQSWLYPINILIKVSPHTMTFIVYFVIFCCLTFLESETGIFCQFLGLEVDPFCKFQSSFLPSSFYSGKFKVSEARKRHYVSASGSHK